MPRHSKRYTVTQRELAGIHGVDVRTVRRWDEEGLPRNKDGSYTPADTILWRVQRETGADLDLNAERARLAKEQADKTALENAARRGQMVDVLSVVNAWTDQIAAARSKLLGAPTKLAPQLVDIRDANVIAAAIRTEVYAALSELTEYDPDPSAGGAAVGDSASSEAVGSAAAPDRQPVGRRKQKAELRE